MHGHPNNFLSGVYYVQTNPGTETVKFNDPRSRIAIIRPPVAELAAQSTDQVVVKVIEGTLLMFPALLWLSVSRDDSDAPRIRVSFNVMVPSFAGSRAEPLW